MDIKTPKPNLLSVPEYQKQWFREDYDTIKNEVEETELMVYSMLENNIFGVNERFIDWNSDLNGLVDDFLENYILQEEKTVFIKDCLLSVLQDCKELEYFEMANNVNLILKQFQKAIFNYEQYNTMKKESLFPVYFNGKKYLKDDCDDVFLAFYHCKESLNDLSGVYLSEGTWVYPDGSMNEF